MEIIMKTETDCIDAVVKHKSALRCVPSTFRGKQWYVAAATNANMRISSIMPGDTPADKEWCVVVIDTNDLITGEEIEDSWMCSCSAGGSLTVLPPSLRTEEACMMAMGVSTEAWEHVPEEIKKQIFAPLR